MKRKIIYFFIILTGLALIAGWGFYIFFPSFLNSENFTRFLEKNGLKKFSWNVRQVTFTKTDIGKIKIGDLHSPGPAISSLFVDYSPFEISRGKIKNIFIDGITFACGIKKGRFFFRGFDIKTEKTEEKSSPGPFLPLPVSFESLKIKNSYIFFEMEDKPCLIPFDLYVYPEKDGNELKGELKIWVRGNKISIGFSVFNDKIDLSLKAKNLFLARFTDFIKAVPGLWVSGKADLAANGEISINPFCINSFSGFFEFYDTSLKYSDSDNRPVFTAHAGSKEKKESFCLKITRKNKKGWAFSATKLFLLSPFTGNIAISSGNIRENQDNYGLDTQIDYSVSQIKDLPVKIPKPMKGKAVISGNFFKDGKWKIKASNKISNTGFDISAPKDTFSFISRAWEFEITGQGDKKSNNLSFSAKVPQIKIKSAFQKISVPVFEITGNAVTNEDKTGQIGFDVNLKQAGITLEKTKIKIPGLFLNGQSIIDRRGKIKSSCVLRISKADFKDTANKIRIKRINLNFPFKWPWEDNNKKGGFSIGKIRYDKFDTGSLKLNIRQTGNGLVFDGAHKLKLIPRAGIKIDGRYKFKGENNSAKIKFKMPYADISRINFTNINPSLKGLDIKGRLKFDGKMEFDKTGLKAGINLMLSKGDIKMAEQAFHMENLNIGLNIPDLLKLKSAPAQTIRFGRCSLGNLNMEKGEIFFQIESPKSVFIEKAGFKWCQGNVNTHSMRIIPDVTDYDMVLYCDRLNLAKVLEQLGGAKADGTGSVNGRIPIKFKNGKLTFNNGFLYSTPGNGGTVHVKAAETIMAGIPKGTPRFSHLELAKAALEDYDYNWVRLKITSKGENIVLKISFDGKPSKPLPFIYDKKFGGFVHIKSGKQVSNFQGIRLNVNFSFPLNKLLRYKNVFDKFNQN